MHWQKTCKRECVQYKNARTASLRLISIYEVAYCFPTVDVLSFIYNTILVLEVFFLLPAIEWKRHQGSHSKERRKPSRSSLKTTHFCCFVAHFYRETKKRQLLAPGYYDTLHFRTTFEWMKTFISDISLNVTWAMNWVTNNWLEEDRRFFICSR